MNTIVKKIIRIITIITVGICSFLVSPAQAYDWSLKAHVTGIEVSYMPGLLRVQIDQAAGACAAGTYLNYNGQGADQTTQYANANVIYSTLLTAMTTNRPVLLYGVNNNCAVQFVYIN